MKEADRLFVLLLLSCRLSDTRSALPLVQHFEGV